MTGNMAYKKKVVIDTGGFDERLAHFEDRDIALRIKKNGKICFNPEMKVYHPRVVLSPREYIKRAAIIKYRVHLFKNFGEKNALLWRICFPTNLIRMLFPLSVFFDLFVRRFSNSNDFKLLPFKYIYVVCERLHLWKECAIERVFLI